MTPQELLRALERMQAAVTLEPLQDGALRATQAASDRARRLRVPGSYRVHTATNEVVIDATKGSVAAVRHAFTRERPAIAADYAARIKRAAKP